MTYKETIEIKGDNRNAVESFINDLHKQTDEAAKFGIEVSIRRIPEETEHEADFNE